MGERRSKARKKGRLIHRKKKNRESEGAYSA